MYSDNILRVATIYATARGITLATVGTYATNDGQFFKRLAAARVTIRRAEGVLRWLSDRWPSGTPWPSDIPRPGSAPVVSGARGEAA